MLTFSFPLNSRMLRWGVFVILVLSCLAGVTQWWSWKTAQAHHRELAQQHHVLQEKMQLHSQITRHLGYGGFIHHFKNYLIRGNTTYRQACLDNAMRLHEMLEHYAQLGDLSQTEADALLSIQYLLEEYQDQLNLVQQAWEHDSTFDVRRLDRQIHVFDGHALRALDSLDAWLQQALADSYQGKALIDHKLQVFALHALGSVLIMFICAVAVLFLWRRLLRSLAINRRSMKALSRSEARQRAFLDSTADAIVMTDQHAHIQQTNQAVETMFGYADHFLQGKHTHILFPEKYRAQVNVFLQHYVSDLSGKVFNSEIQVKACRADGSTFPVEISINKTELQGKTVLTGVIRDITDRIRMRSELDHQRSLFESVFNNTPNAMFVADNERRILLCNSMFEQLFGYPAEALKGRTTACLYADEEEYFATWRKLTNLKDGAQFQVAGLHLKTKTGHVFAAESSGAFWINKKGEQQGYIAIIRDITQRLAQEAALRRSEANFADAQALAQLGHWHWLMPQRQVEWSAEMYRIFELDPEQFEPSAQTFLKFVHPDDKARVQRDLQRTLLGSKRNTPHIEFRIKTHTQKVKWLKSTGRLDIDAQENPEHLVTVVQDISYYKRIQKDLEQARKSAEAANQAKSAFLANMSHELRTPLNAILGFAQLLQQSATLDQQQQQQVKSIYNGGQYLLSLINDVLDLAKIESERLELFPEEVELGSLFEDIADMFRFRAESKGIHFDYQVNAPLPFSLWIDGKCLRQVVINLLGNAIKFTDQGSVALNATLHEERLQIEVKDTGSGIAAEQINQVFKAFVQVGDKRHQRQGTGLGLAITHKLVKLMNGDIQVSSELGQGSCFRVELPVVALQNTRVAEAPEQIRDSIVAYRREDGTDAPLRLLIVDDVPENREILSQLLTPLGFEVQEVDSGEACLVLVQNWIPDLVFMDIRLQGIDGLTTTQRLHQIPGLENLRVMAISASTFPDNIEEAHAAGCVEYLQKPVDFIQIYQMLAKYLPLSWVYASKTEAANVSCAEMEADVSAEAKALGFSSEQTQRLCDMVDEGDVTGLVDYLETLCKTQGRSTSVGDLLNLANDFRLDEIKTYLAGVTQVK